MPSSIETGPAATAIAKFRQAVVADPALQARLGALEMPEAFMAEVLAAAGALGLAISEDALCALNRPDPLGLSRFQTAPVELDRWPGIGWLPARSVPTGGAPAFDWVWFGDRSLKEPFYEDTARRMGSRPLSRMFRTRTSLEALVAGADDEETLAPNGFIFHMSRCGSTLAAQMLASPPHHIVLSEAEPIDAVVQWALMAHVPIAAQVKALRAIVAAYGRNRGSSARRFFLKLDCWHTCAMPLFRTAFPDVPWLFLYREPTEVMASHARQPGGYVVPEALASLIFDFNPGTAVSLEDREAMALGQLLRVVADYLTLGGGMLVNYADLPVAMATTIPAHFGFTPDDEEAYAMDQARWRDAKAPDRSFNADSEEKRAAVTPAIIAAVQAHLRRPYQSLEALRTRAGLASG